MALDKLFDFFSHSFLTYGSYINLLLFLRRLNKSSVLDSGDARSIPGSGRSRGVGNGNPLQYSCLENPMDRGAWRATVHGVTKESAAAGHRLNNSRQITIQDCPGP